jgi:hypothetical protein
MATNGVKGRKYANVIGHGKYDGNIYVVNMAAARKEEMAKNGEGKAVAKAY